MLGAESIEKIPVKHETSVRVIIGFPSYAPSVVMGLAADQPKDVGWDISSPSRACPLATAVPCALP